VLAFARSLGEFGATITFVSNIPGETQTLPLAIYTYTQVPGGDAQAWRLSAMAVILSIAALMAAEWIARRKPGHMRGAAEGSRATFSSGWAISPSRWRSARRRRSSGSSDARARARPAS